VLAAYEDATGKHSWRHLDPATARYLHFLTDAGYTHSPVEHLACSQQPPAADARYAVGAKPGEDTSQEVLSRSRSLGGGYGEASRTNAALRPWRPLGANHRRPPGAGATPSGPGGDGYRELSRPAAGTALPQGL